MDENFYKKCIVASVISKTVYELFIISFLNKSISLFTILLLSFSFIIVGLILFLFTIMFSSICFKNAKNYSVAMIVSIRFLQLLWFFSLYINISGAHSFILLNTLVVFNCIELLTLFIITIYHAIFKENPPPNPYILI